MGVDNRLNYLEETKTQIKDAIESTGIEVDSDLPFSSYPNKIQEIIDTKITPQSVLEALILKTEIINGEEVN